ncbi:MAG: chorismate-binding protein, partial [Pirellulales bacterium]
MLHLPDFETFCRLAEDANLVPVYRRLLSDSLTPVSAFHKIDQGVSACLFESVIGGEKVGRYSFLAAEPFFEFDARGHRVTISSDGTSRQLEVDDPLDELRRQVQQIRTVRIPELPPFTSGAVGYAGYDTIRYSEQLPDAPPDDRHLPDLSFAFYDRMVVFDHVNKTVMVVVMARLPSTDGRRSESTLRGAYDEACKRIDALVEDLAASSQPLDGADIDTTGAVEIAYPSNFTQERFETAVRTCVDYIRAGDIFQVVISQRMTVPIVSDPFEIYRTLRVVNPSPFMFYLRTSAA